MKRLRLHRRPDADARQSNDQTVIRRFFALIQRLERPFRREDELPAPEVKARITALGDDPIRPN